MTHNPANPDEEMLAEHAALQYALGLLRYDGWAQSEAYLKASRRGPAATVAVFMRVSQLLAEVIPFGDERDKLIGRLQARMDTLTAGHGAVLAADDDRTTYNADDGWLGVGDHFFDGLFQGQGGLEVAVLHVIDAAVEVAAAGLEVPRLCVRAACAQRDP